MSFKSDKNILNTMLNHRSVRSYETNKPIEPEKLDLIINSCNQAPTSINGQTLTILNIEDIELRKQVAELSWGQQHIIDCSTFLIFVIDFNKSNIALEKQGKELKITDGTESLLIGSVDIGISLGIATYLAEAQGLYTCAIGAVRYSAEKMAKLLNLPHNSFAVVGLCLGYAKGELPDVKPKMPTEGFCLSNKYNQEIVKNTLYKYDDEIMKDYFIQRGEPNALWSDKVANFYSQNYYPNLSAFIKKQGFNNL